jgi:hypothetical protein
VGQCVFDTELTTLEKGWSCQNSPFPGLKRQPIAGIAGGFFVLLLLYPAIPQGIWGGQGATLSICRLTGGGHGLAGD